MNETIVIFGGTGRVGEPVARQLLSEGCNVRVFTRDERSAKLKLGSDVEFVRGDVADLSAVERAMSGCTYAHISLDGRGDWDIERRGVEHVAQAGARVGLKHITLTSGATTCEENAWFPMIRAKLDGENALRRSGVPFTIFRCTMFMETLPAFVRDGKAVLMGNQPAPFRWVAATDYAALVLKAHRTDAAHGKTLYVYGPEPFTMKQALEVYCAVCAPGAKLAHVPFWMLSVISLFPGRSALRRVALPLMEYFSKVKETGDASETDTLLGKPSTTLREWCGLRMMRPQ